MPKWGLSMKTGKITEWLVGPAVATVEVDGRSISHATSGSGDDVVVLVHGYGGDKNSWLFVQEAGALDSEARQPGRAIACRPLPISEASVQGGNQ